MWSKNIQTFLGCDAEYADANIVLLGAPYDSTTSFRPGARFGCRAMRADSFGLETFSPYQEGDLSDCAVFDSGDIELPFGAPEPVLEMIRARAATILSDGKLPFLLGGEHLVTLGAVRATAEKYPGLRILHFDAHADLRDDYLGNPLSHACVLRRCWDLLGDGRIFQFGIRSGAREEFAWAAQDHVLMCRFGFAGLEDALARTCGMPVYLSVDLDVLDPALFPGTGTPEAGGATFAQVLEAALCICRKANVVACDLVELAPALDPSGVSTATACKLLREMLIALEKRKE